MSAAAGIRAGRAYVEMTINNAALARGLRAAQRRLASFAASAGQLGTRMVGAGIAMAAPLALSTKTFADFEKQMASVSTMLDEPEKYMAGFNSGIREMSVRFGEGTDTLAKGLYDILSASIPASKALDVLEVATRAATAGLSDTGTAADAITTVLNSYRMDASKAAEVSDWLFSVVKKGKTTFAELAPAIGNVANVAANAGVGLEELGAGVAFLTRNGIKTDEAITSLRTIITSFIKPAAESSAMAKKLGFEMSVATLEAEGLAGVFKRLEGLGPEVIGELFPNVRALKGALPILGNLADFGGDIKAMAGSAGATEIAFKKMAKTLIFAFGRILQAGKLVMSTIGESLSPEIKAVTEIIVSNMTSIGGLISRNQGLVVVVAKVALGLIAAGAALIGIAGAAIIGGMALSGIVMAMSAVGTLAGFMASALATAVGPMGLLGAAAVALGYYIATGTQAGGDALNWLGDQFSELKTTMDEVWSAMANAVAGGEFTLAIDVLWKTLKLGFVKGTQALKDIWHKFGGWFVETATTTWYSSLRTLQKVLGAIETAIAHTKRAITSIWSDITIAVKADWLKTQRDLAKDTHRLMNPMEKKEDREQTYKFIDDDYNGQIIKLYTAGADADAKRKKELDAKIISIQTNEETELNKIKTAQEESVFKRTSAGLVDAIKAGEEVEKARADLRDAVKTASAVVPNSHAVDGKQSVLDDMFNEMNDGQAPDDGASIGDNLREAIAAIPTAVGVAAQGLESRGTFNASALVLNGIGGSASVDKSIQETAANTREMAGSLAKIERKEGLTF